MNANEIIKILKQDSNVAPFLLGVFSCDNLPTASTFPCALIANTDPRNKSGEHWIGIFVTRDRHIMYFDSYGFPPVQKEFINFLASIANAESIASNTIQLQNPLSSACGQFAIFFLSMACRGCTMKEIQGFFEPNDLMGKNDRRVTDFVNENYNVETNAFDYDYVAEQICKSMKDVMVSGKYYCPKHL